MSAAFRRTTGVVPGGLFVSYRRADEPFGAALLAAELVRRYGRERVFLDTLALRPRSDPSRTLPRALAASAAVVAFVGPRWDTGERLERLHDERDWVRRELLDSGATVVPVFFNRAAALSEDVPTMLRLAVRDPVEIRRHRLGTGIDALVERISRIPGTPVARLAGADRMHDRLDGATRGLGVDAMLRHVIPEPQQWSGNRAMIVRATLGLLEASDWLRHVAAAALPGRPNGSGVVAVTDGAVAVADLDNRFKIGRRERIAVDDVVAVDLVPRRRAGIVRIADVRFRTSDGSGPLLTGLFREEANEMLEILPDQLRTAAR